MPAMERSGRGRVGGLRLFGPASAAAEVVNSVSDPSPPPAVRARLRTGAGNGHSKKNVHREERTERQTEQQAPNPQKGFSLREMAEF